jgi:hypothetical protein
MNFHGSSHIFATRCTAIHNFRIFMTLQFLNIWALPKFSYFSNTAQCSGHHSWQLSLVSTYHYRPHIQKGHGRLTSIYFIDWPVLLHLDASFTWKEIVETLEPTLIALARRSPLVSSSPNKTGEYDRDSPGYHKACNRHVYTGNLDGN